MKFEQLFGKASFEEVVTPFLSEREAENNLLLGIASTDRDWTDVWIGVVRDDSDSVCRAAICTPPFGVAVSAGQTGSAQLAEGIAGSGISVPWVLTDLEDAADFATALSLSAEGTDAQHIYALESVEAVASAEGEMRDATEKDLDLLVEWWKGFHDEVKLPAAHAEVDHIESVTKALGQARLPFVVWQHKGELVSMAKAVGDTPTGVRVAAVFTPNEHRRRGYATNLVAKLTQRLLNDGRSRVFLFAQASNSTSNSIYKKMGYRRVRTVVRLEPKSS